MTARLATSEEIRALNAPNVRKLTPDEVSQLGITSNAESPPGIISRTIQRALGTDLEDPLEWERLGTVALGGIGGSVIGSKVPPIPGLAGIFINPVTGAIAGGVAGVVGGAVAPEGTLELLESLGVLPKNKREEKGLSNAELERVVYVEATLELLTAGTISGLRLAGRTFGQVATGVGKEEMELAEKASKEGINLAPFQVGERGLGRCIINVLGRFPILGGYAKAVGTSAEQSVKTVKEKLPSRIAPLIDSSDLGTKIYNESKNLFKATMGSFEKRYEDLFLEANRAGVKITPVYTKEAAEAVLKKIQPRRPLLESGKTISGAEATEVVAGFITKNITKLDDQSLGQMDEFILKIDQTIAASKKSIRPTVARLFAPIRGAAKADVVGNIRFPDGTEAVEIGEKLARIDADYSHTLSFLFETSTANKIARVKQGGLRGGNIKATKTPTDKLSGIILDMNSPQAVDELSRLVNPSTFDEIGSRALADIFDKAMTTFADNSVKMDADALAKGFGLIGSDKTRLKVIEKLISNSGLTIDDLKTIVSVVDKLANSPIPDFSTFVARRAVLGGSKGIIGGVVPFLAFSGTGAAAGGAAGAILGALMFIGGSRLLVGAVSNPSTARELKNVLNEEASMLVKREALLRIGRFSILAGKNAGEYTLEQTKEMLSATQELANSLFPEEKK